MKYILLILLIVIASLTTSYAGRLTNIKHDRHVKRLYETMQGRYSSEAQSKADDDFFNISLRMLPIWTERGYYLYVEQALADRQDKPYRVRVYRLVPRGKNEIVSEIYTLKNEKAWVGRWENVNSFSDITTDELELKAGCEVVLKKVGPNRYEGSTTGTQCPSDLRGAKYATTKVIITPDRMSSWDQGFDAYGNQVWGPTKGPYHFDKTGKP